MKWFSILKVCNLAYLLLLTNVKMLSEQEIEPKLVERVRAFNKKLSIGALMKWQIFSAYLNTILNCDLHCKYL